MLAIIRCRIFCLPVCYPKKTKIRVYRTVVLPVVLYGCETWSLTLREEQRLRVFENRVLRGYLGLRGTRRRGIGEDYITRNLMTCTHQKYYSGNQIEKNEMGGACSTYGGKERCIQDFCGET
jgi:hypothetical protein